MNKAQCVQAFGGKRPVLGNDVFVAPNASVIGDVKLGSGASVWYGAVIRGETPGFSLAASWARLCITCQGLVMLLSAAAVGSGETGDAGLAWLVG